MKTTNAIQRGRMIKKIEPYVWLLPCLLLIVIFILYPVVNVIYMSFCKVSRSGLIKSFGTLDNFQKIFEHKAFSRVILNTFIWTIVVVGVSTVFGLIMALVLNTSFKGRKIARAILVIPWATSGMVLACTWKYIFDFNYGSLNSLLMHLGIVEKEVNWLGGSSYGAFACMMFVGITVTVPFISFTLLSGLQSIPNDFYEAARIDGANFWHRLTLITLPLLKPALNVSTVLNIIYVFNSFAIVHNMTGGAPAHQTGTIMTYIYTCFGSGDYGKSAAASVVGFAILMIIATLYMRMLMKEE